MTANFFRVSNLLVSTKTHLAAYSPVKSATPL
jgi:hypothetical protein